MIFFVFYSRQCNVQDVGNGKIMMLQPMTMKYWWWLIKWGRLPMWVSTWIIFNTKRDSFIQEDKQLNLDQKAATKKLKLLPSVLAQMNKYVVIIIMTSLWSNCPFCVIQEWTETRFCGVWGIDCTDSEYIYCLYYIPYIAILGMVEAATRPFLTAHSNTWRHTRYSYYSEFCIAAYTGTKWSDLSRAYELLKAVKENET